MALELLKDNDLLKCLTSNGDAGTNNPTGVQLSLLRDLLWNSATE